MVHIAASELVIMKELWKESPLTSREIIDRIDNKSDWNAKTVHTLISRLCKKGAVRSEKIEGTPFYNYYACISENECAKEEARSFIDRMFSGSVKKFVSAFVQDGNVSREEISELRKMLEKYENGDRE